MVYVIRLLNKAASRKMEWSCWSNETNDQTKKETKRYETRKQNRPSNESVKMFNYSVGAYRMLVKLKVALEFSINYEITIILRLLSLLF